MASSLLEVRDLHVRFVTSERTVRAVNGVSFSVQRGEMLGIVGESGSGKTVTVLSTIGLVPTPPGEITNGSAIFEGRNLMTLEPEELRSIRGSEIAVVFQDPMTSLNPVLRIGDQIREALAVHASGVTRKQHVARAIELLALVGVPQPDRRYRQYPHEFSGGMRQRAMIAMAIANKPKLLVADEPTTALDVTIQAQVLDVLMAAKAEIGAATILISHDLGLVSQVADRVIVMYAGRVVEEGTAEDVFIRPHHPYTVGLMASLPMMETRRKRLYSIPGRPPNMTREPDGCPFRVRCGIGRDQPICRSEMPQLLAIQPTHFAACHYADEAARWIPTGDGDRLTAAEKAHRAQP